MTLLFLPPPLDAPEMLCRILGAPGLAMPRRATLVDYRMGADDSGIRAGLVAAPGGSVAGGLVSADAQARAPLDFVMAALGASPAPVTVIGEGGPAAAVAYVFATPLPGSWPAGSDEADARLREALEEIAGHAGRLDAAAMQPLLYGISIRALGRARAGGEPRPVRLSLGLGAADVEPVGRELAYARYFGVEEHQLRHRRFDGAMSDVLGRGVFTSGDAVSVVPFDPWAQTVLLIEQFRAGPHARHDPQPWSIEAVAGRCDRAEPVETTVRREAREEAGLELGRLERIVGYYPSPGIMSEYITAFVGEADLSGAGGTHGLAEENEDIRAMVVPLATAVAAAENGEINNAPLLLSLFWLARHAERLARAWGPAGPGAGG